MQRGARLSDLAGHFSTTTETLERDYGHHHPDYQSSALAAIERRRTQNETGGE